MKKLHIELSIENDFPFDLWVEEIPIRNREERAFQ